MHTTRLVGTAYFAGYYFFSRHKIFYAYGLYAYHYLSKAKITHSSDFLGLKKNYNEALKSFKTIFFNGQTDHIFLGLLSILNYEQKLVWKLLKKKTQLKGVFNFKSHQNHRILQFNSCFYFWSAYQLLNYRFQILKIFTNHLKII